MLLTSAFLCHSFVMEAWLKGFKEDAKTYGEILRNCSLSEVSDWGTEDLQRAFQWSDYFDNIQKRVARKQSVVKRLDSELRALGKDLGVRFGERELCYDFLSDSLDYFTKGLLDNPELPREVQDEITSKLAPTTSQQHLAETEDARNLLTVLRTMDDRLTECIGEKDVLHNLKALDAWYLRGDIAWLLQQEGSKESKDSGKRVAERLQSLSGTDGGMEVILTSLLQGSESWKWLDCGGTGDFDCLDPSQKAVFDWLMSILVQPKVKEESSDNKALLELLWQRSNSKLLAQVSSKYFDFFKAHLKLLVRKTKEVEKLNMEISLNIEEDLSVALEQQKKLKECVLSHWVELSLAGEDIKEVCLSVLKPRALPHLACEKTRTESELVYARCCSLGLLGLIEEDIWKAIVRAILKEKQEK